MEYIDRIMCIFHAESPRVARGKNPQNMSMEYTYGQERYFL